MNKVINGKRYDTDTAKRLTCWWHGAPGDLDFELETLYVKRTGEYFLLGEGGARSAYAELDSLGGSRYGKSIIPLTLTEAIEWGQEHLDADSYAAIFEEVC